ncbi:MAG: macrolide family glycosyltransferase, partial [Microbacterium sp.]
MSTIAFVNVAMHGHINPTLPVVAELSRRGHAVSYHTTPSYAPGVDAAGATSYLYTGQAGPLPQHPTALNMLESLVASSQQYLPALLDDLHGIQPDIIVHGAACPWGLIAARTLELPAVSAYTTFAFDAALPSPTGAIGLGAFLVRHPRDALRYLGARADLDRRYRTGGLPRLDLANIHEPLNLVFTSPEFQPHSSRFDPTYRFVGPSLGVRPINPPFPGGLLHKPILYASLGTVYRAPIRMLRALAEALATEAGTVVLATGDVSPADLGALPSNVVAQPFVPQPEVLARTAVFVTHGGMNSVNEALHAGVPMLVIPQGADQPAVARRVVELGAGLSIRSEESSPATIRMHARRLLNDSRFRIAAQRLQRAQRAAGGAARAADEIEAHVQH